LGGGLHARMLCVWHVLVTSLRSLSAWETMCYKCARLATQFAGRRSYTSGMVILSSRGLRVKCFN
jgi:hypothetical protein